jgi:Flp pilus assembly protein TadD
VTGRPPDAQECFDLAVSAVSMGEISTAIGLLRRALQLSPRDPEISALLGQLAFRDRQAPTR